MAVTKVTLVDGLDKMRPQTTPSKEYSILMGLNLKKVSKNTKEKMTIELEPDKIMAEQMKSFKL